MLSSKNETPHGRVSDLDRGEVDVNDSSNYEEKRAGIVSLLDRARYHAYLS